MKRLLMVIMIMSLFLVSGCVKKENEEENQGDKQVTDAIKFKEEYESLNGKKNAAGKEYRTVTIDSDNPYVFISPEEVIEKIENKETFYIYFGDKQCPWCRSSIEKNIEVAKRNNIEIIYYVDVWDDEHNEILRDTYKLDKKNKPVKEKDGTEEYYKLLNYFDNVLEDYTLNTDKGKKVKVKEKRIYAPNYIYVKDGVAVKMVSGTSDKQTDSRMQLTDEMLEDQDKIFTEFFDNKK